MAWYDVDENGMIVSSGDVSTQYGDIFTAFSPDEPIDSSSGNSISQSDMEEYIQTLLSDYNDGLIQTMANMPNQTVVYPNTTAVNVWSYVLSGLNQRVGYVAVSGSNSNTNVSVDDYLYYAADYIVNGKTITLKSPVTVCHYYVYRTSSNTSYLYTYNTQIFNDDYSISLSSNLAYTNLVDGYPDLLGSSKHLTDVIISGVLLISTFIAVTHFLGRRLKK